MGVLYIPCGWLAVRSALPLVTRRAWSIRTVGCCPTDWSGRSLFVRMEWCRGAVRHSSLMRLCVASAAVATRSSLFHFGPDYASWVACWSSVSPWIADLAWNSQGCSDFPMSLRLWGIVVPHCWVALLRSMAIGVFLAEVPAKGLATGVPLAT
ncbi:hypothetical protein BHM03_00043967 [Ensete ventricosum]|nr:hypothetical protein BHM03_00043967 [Ensete ventricosum]